MRRILRLLSLCSTALMLAGSAYAQQSELKAEELIGTYTHTGRFAGSAITIELDGRYHTNSSDCTQEYYEAGTYTFKGGVISFTTTKSTVKSHGQSDNQARNLLDPEVYKQMFQREMPTDAPKDELVPVKWGERLYLMRAESLAEFCNAINLGLEPRQEPGSDWYLGSFFLRDGDEKKSTSGYPALPKKLIDLLLDKPVEAQIINIEFKDDTQIALIDKGRDAGLKAGMRLVLTEGGFGDGPSLWSGFVVLSVSHDIARLKPFAEAKIGDKVSSKFVDSRYQ